MKATAKLMIAIHCAGMPFNGTTIPAGKSLGGSESAAYFMAKELAKRGHKVVLFTMDPEAPGNHEGVVYDFMGELSNENPLGERFMQAMKAPWDVVIVQRHPLGFVPQYNSKLNILWLHDLALYRQRPAIENSIPFIDQVFTVSEFHKQQVHTVFGIEKDFITATWNGVDYDMLEQYRGLQRVPRSLVFASRPERGLQNLVDKNGIMEMLPDCKLFVCGYDNTTAHMRDYYEYLWDKCEKLPNVENLGALGKADLYKLLGESMLYVYPTLFEDTSNIMLLESNAVGTPFIGPKNLAALPETGKNAGVFWVPLRPDGEIDNKAFAMKIKDVLDLDVKWQSMHKKALRKKQTWASAAEQWENKFFSLLKERSKDKIRLYHHFERMSDIIPIMYDAEYDADCVQSVLSDFKHNYRFLLDGNFKKHYDEYYEYEKNRGVEYGPEDLTGNGRFEQTVNIIRHLNPKTILDYGCAHGHYVMNLAERFPDVTFHGVDINKRNIGIANKWLSDIENKRQRNEFIWFDCGGTEILTAKYDLIVCAEVLEHVLDPVSIVHKLKKHLSDDGHILITTPYGPWEAIGYKKHKGWRAHIHHFERADLCDMFESQKDFNLIALPHTDTLGHYFVTFQNCKTSIGCIDYERKLRTQAPRQTISACLLACDEADVIGKCLRTLEDVADEIIVAIDSKTTDGTAEICKKFDAEIVSIPDVFRIGFDEARNISIQNARMDWIFWLDADETLERSENIYKYLRESTVTGFGIPQHHFAVEPVGNMKTDYPVRLFRNHKGIRFFGVVHEHPEKEINKGIGVVKMINDFSVMHTGYSTEAIRRKRFERNFPLMQQDHKKYPDRILGRFLWLRDLAQLIKYTLERTRGTVVPAVEQYAKEGIAVFRKMLEEENVRLLVDALPFYSECVSIATRGNGIEYLVTVASQKGFAKRKLGDQAPVYGLFANAKDIKTFQAVLTSKLLDLYEEKYF